MDLEVDCIAVGEHQFVFQLVVPSLLQFHVQYSTAHFEHVLDSVVSSSGVSFRLAIGVDFDVKLMLRLLNHFAESG